MRTLHTDYFWIFNAIALAANLWLLIYLTKAIVGKASGTTLIVSLIISIFIIGYFIIRVNFGPGSLGFDEAFRFFVNVLAFAPFILMTPIYLTIYLKQKTS